MEGRRTHYPTKGSKKGDKHKASGRRTHHPTPGSKQEDKAGNMGNQADKVGDKLGRSGETRLGEKLGDKPSIKGEKGEGGHTSNKRKQEGRQAGRQYDRQGLGKADTPSNQGPQEAVQWETEGDKTVAKADSPSNKGNKKGHNMGD